MTAAFDKLTVTPDLLDTAAAVKMYQALGVIHVAGALPPDLLFTVRDEILDLLSWLEGEVGERVPYITSLRGEYDPAMADAYERLVLVLNETLSPHFPYREAIATVAECQEIQVILAYAREAQGGGGSSAHVDFHQDYPTFCRASNIENHLNPKRTITCWIPLDEMDEETPTIEYIPARLNVELPTTSEGILDMGQVGDALAKLPNWVPPVSLGDFVLHDQFTLHRSHVTPLRTKVRRSFELRFVMR